MTINGGNICNRIVALLSLGFLYLAATQKPIVCAAEFFGLGLTTPPGPEIFQNPNTVAIEASNDGQVVSGQQFGRPFRWTRQTGAVLLDQSFPSYSWFDEKPAMSGDGSVLVGNLIHTSQGIFAYQWTENTGTVLIGKGEAWGVSRDGSTVVGSRLFYDGPPPTRLPGFRWTAATGFANLSPPSEYPWHLVPTAVSADGSVVVGGSAALEPSVVWKALRWTDSSVPEVLTDGLATAITPDGRVVIGLTNPNSFGPWSGRGEAFRWTRETGAVTLGVLPGTSFSDAQDVSADGQRIVGRSWNYNATSVRTLRSFLWDPIHGMRDLKTVLETDYGLGAELAGWQLEHAIGISDDGTTIVGSGVNPSGDHDSWVARIDPILEPSGIALLTAAAAIVAFVVVGRTRARCVSWLLFALISFEVSNSQASPIEWPIATGGNGHFYELVVRDVGPVGWHQARAEAASMQWMGTFGHLATITSASETEFVRTHFPRPPFIYIGGFQDRNAPDFSEPAGGWRWVTGEAWQYTNWEIDEPNNYPGYGPEDFLQILGNGNDDSGWGWNDNHDAATSGLTDFWGFLVEFPVTVPEPSTILLSLLGTGCWIGFAIRKSSRRRSAADPWSPAVLAGFDLVQFSISTLGRSICALARVLVSFAINSSHSSQGRNRYVHLMSFSSYRPVT
jgi:uncharacterized membrane protein